MGAVKNHPRSAGNDTGRRIQTGNGGHTKTKAAMGFIMQCTHRNIRRVSPPSGLVIADVIGHDGLNRTSNSLINSNHRCGVGLGSRARVRGNRIVVCIVLHDGAIRTALLQLNGDVLCSSDANPRGSIREVRVITSHRVNRRREDNIDIGRSRALVQIKNELFRRAEVTFATKSVAATLPSSTVASGVPPSTVMLQPVSSTSPLKVMVLDAIAAALMPKVRTRAAPILVSFIL